MNASQTTNWPSGITVRLIQGGEEGRIGTVAMIDHPQPHHSFALRNDETMNPYL